MLSLFSLFLALGCNNPTADILKSQIGSGGIDGLKNLDDVESISLVDPDSSPHENKTPTIRVSGLKADDLVHIYKDARCSNLLTEKKSEGDELDILLPTLGTGQHRFYAKRSWPEEGISSPCSSIYLLYEVTSADPMITGLSNDNTPKKTKTWNWSCSGTMPPCTYRFTVDTNPNTNPTGSFNTAATATQSSGTGTYYLHIQAKDQGGNLSSLLHISAKLDNTGPRATAAAGPPKRSLYFRGTSRLRLDL